MNETSTTAGSPGEILSRRCVGLVKTGLKPDMWPNCDLKLASFDKLLMTVVSPHACFLPCTTLNAYIINFVFKLQDSQTPNFGNICTALDMLGFLLTILRKEAILGSFKHLQRGIAACMSCPNTKVVLIYLYLRAQNIFEFRPEHPHFTQ